MAGRSSAIRVRDARPEDRQFVLELAPELLAFGPPGWRNREEMVAVDRRVLASAFDTPSSDASVLIAEDLAGERLGFIHVVEEDDYYGGPCGHVADIVVAPPARGRGVGRLLLEAGEKWARSRGYALFTLNVFLDNVNARELYERVGFHPETLRLVKPLA